MARAKDKMQRQSETARYSYLIREYDQEGFPIEGAGFRFSKDEALAVKRELEALYPGREYFIEEFDRSRYLRNFRDTETSDTRSSSLRRRRRQRK